MLPMTVLRRFDCVLASTKEKVLREHERQRGKFKDDALDKVLDRAAGQRFHNHSSLIFEKLKGDPDHIDKLSSAKTLSGHAIAQSLSI
jgi:type I restriction enzyme M protein